MSQFPAKNDTHNDGYICILHIIRRRYRAKGVVPKNNFRWQYVLGSTSIKSARSSYFSRVASEKRYVGTLNINTLRKNTNSQRFRPLKVSGFFLSNS